MRGRLKPRLGVLRHHETGLRRLGPLAALCLSGKAPAGVLTAAGRFRGGRRRPQARFQPPASLHDRSIEEGSLASNGSAPVPIAEMTGLVDLHSHVLPRVDDGARDDDEALRMLRVAEEDGIATIAATPHSHHFPGALVPERAERLNRLAADAGLT